MNPYVFPVKINMEKLSGGDEEYTVHNQLTLRDLFAVAIVQGMVAHYGRTMDKGGVDPAKLWATVDLILAAR